MKTLSYDFEVTSFVGVEAPEGTDPDLLREQAVNLFIERLNRGEAEVECFQTYDSETGENEILTGKNKGQKTLVHGGTEN